MTREEMQRQALELMAKGIGQPYAKNANGVYTPMPPASDQQQSCPVPKATDSSIINLGNIAPVGINMMQNTGTHSITWNGKDNNRQIVGSGIYN